MKKSGGKYFDRSKFQRYIARSFYAPIDVSLKHIK